MLFDTLRAHTRPYGEPLHGLDGLDTRILRLLLAGFPDTAVAGQPDLST
ncbi:hypothetical protein [Streptomyces sp. NPDC014734]